MGIKKPRTPAAFMRRTRWSIAEQRLRGAHEAEQKSFDWRSNYASALPRLDELDRQLEDLADRGKAIKLTETAMRKRWPSAIPASLGVLEKIGPRSTFPFHCCWTGCTGWMSTSAFGSAITCAAHQRQTRRHSHEL